MRTSCPAPGAARTCSVIILYQSEDQQELFATGDDLSYSIWALWGCEVVSGKSSSLVEKHSFRHFSKLSRPKVRFKDTQQIILFQHRSNRNCSQPPSAQIKNPCYQANNVNRPSTTNKERKGSLTLTFPSITTVSPLSTTLLTQPLTFIPANGVHCALE